MIAVGDSRATAIAVGFDPNREYSGYGVEVFAYFILEDPWFAAEFDKNWQREIRECSEASHPDHVLLATLESLSEIEKAGLRMRVTYAMEKWDAEPTRQNLSQR